MKKGCIEEFIAKNRGQWDDKKAPSQIWEKINDDLDADLPKPAAPWQNIIIIFLIVTALLVVFYIVNNNPDYSLSKEPQNIIEYAELEDFKETEHFYLSSINVNYQKLNQYKIDATLEEDLRLLDEIYTELMDEYILAQSPYKEQVLRAIIQNHKTKLQILENVLYHHAKHDKQSNEEIF